MNKSLKISSCALVILLTNFSCHLSLADTANNLTKFDCTLTDQVNSDDQAGEEKSTFTTDTARIYLVCSSDDVKQGQMINSQWIAADTNKVAPPNYKIDEKSLQVPKNLNDNQTFTTKFSLSKPNNGWPVGTYHVDIYVDGQLVKSVPFTISK